MKQSSCLLLVILGCIAVHSTSAAEIKVGKHTFTLPDGFEIEQIAGPPLVDRPIVADFDDEGRLYVADSSGSNDNVQKQLAEKPHRIMRLDDTDGDGRFDRSVIFADKMMFPEGAMWLEGSLYVGAPPSIWKLTDSDGDGVAEKREEWFAGKTLNGCANDLHGPYAGPDGWIYWCKGAFEKQTYERPGKHPFVTTAAHIFRCRRDGTGIEPVMTGGMDNPVDVVFTPGGERIFTTTFLQNPGNGKRDGLIHAVYGGVYGKVSERIETHLRTGDVLPVLSHLGAAAPCGLTRYESSVFGDEYRDNLFACCFNMRKVTRHVLSPDGATFKSRDEDFLVSDNLDFHPTDVHEDADGSLVVIDTGGWYKLCCPTSQLHKPDVLGAIYRVRRTDAPRIVDPRGSELSWTKMNPEELARLLADSRPAVRRRGISELARRKDAAVPVLSRIAGVFGFGQDESRDGILEKQARVSPRMRTNAVWALTRIDSANARAALRWQALEPNETVRQAAAHSISLWRDKEATLQLKMLLQLYISPQNWRVAVEGLGRIGDKSFVPDLLGASARLSTVADSRDWMMIDTVTRARIRLGTVPPRFLEHSLIYALIELADAEKTAKGLDSEIPAVRRVALIALDQMPGGSLDPQMVAGLLGSPEPVVRETAVWIVGRHPEWGDALAGYLRSRLEALADSSLTARQGIELEDQLVLFTRSAAVQQLLAQMVDDPESPPAARHLAFRAIARSALREPPAAWVAALTKVLAGGDAAQIEQAVAAARALPAAKNPDPKFVAALLAVGGRTDSGTAVRINALAGVPGGPGELSPALFDFLRGNFHPEQDVLLRSSAADVLARSKLTTAQLVTLSEAFQEAGPLEADRLLPAYKECADESVGTALVAALKDSPALAGLRIDALKINLARFPTVVQKRAEELYAIINVDLAKQREKLESLLASLKPGDIRRGQAIFNSTKAACAACHPFGYLGGNVGPDLTSIGKSRQERDLLEAIVFPSASFVRSFEPVVVLTKSGKSHNGLVKKDSADEVILATGPKEEVRIAKDEIEEMRPSTVSVMPSGLDQQLSPQDLADLIAFLKNAK